MIRIAKLLIGLVGGILVSSTFWYVIAAKTVVANYTLRPNTHETEGRTIYLISNGVHTDVCIPLQPDYSEWQQLLSGQLPPKNTYIAIGWGDKGFYLNTPTWNDLTLSTAINAVFLPSETAMHVTYYTQAPQEVPGKIIALNLCNNQLDLLTRFIWGSFKKNEQSAGILIQKPTNYQGHNQFYEAYGSYHGFRTCNEWTREALSAALVPTPVWTPFSKDLMNSMEP